MLLDVYLYLRLPILTIDIFRLIVELGYRKQYCKNETVLQKCNENV